MADNFDVEKIMNIVKTISSGNSDNRSEDMSDNTEVNIPVQKGGVEMIKAAIPYLDEKYQQNIGVMIKLIEIDSLLNNFKTMSIDGENTTERRTGILKAVKPVLDYKKGKIVDIIMRVMEINDIAEELANAE